MCTTESVVLGVTPKGRADTNRWSFSSSEGSDTKEEEPFITSRNRGYSVDSDAILPSEHSSSRRDRRVLRKRSKSPSRTSSIIPQTYERDRSVSSVSASPVKAKRKSNYRPNTPKQSRSSRHDSPHSPQKYRTASPPSARYEHYTKRTSSRKYRPDCSIRCSIDSNCCFRRRSRLASLCSNDCDRSHKNDVTEEDSVIFYEESDSESFNSAGSRRKASPKDDYHTDEEPSVIINTPKRDRSVSSVSYSPVKAHLKRSRTPSRSSRQNSPREYKTESSPSARPERYSERTSRRKCRSGVKKRDSRPASPTHDQLSEDEPNSKYGDMSMVSDSFLFPKSGIPDYNLEEINVDKELFDMVSRFGSEECLGAVKYFSNMMFRSFMKKYLELCPEEYDGVISGSMIKDLAILATLNSAASEKKKNELRKAWKILLANTIINNAVVTYHYSKCSGNVNKRQKEDPQGCPGKPFLFGMTPHAYFSVDMIDNILNKTLEELIEEAFPNVYEIDTVTYSELAEKLKASVVRSSSSKRNAKASQWLEINFRASESIAASKNKDSSFGQFLLNYLHDPERKIFRSIAQALSNAKKMDWCHPMLRMNKHICARQSARETRTQKRMSKFTRSMTEVDKKESQLLALYKTPAFQAKLLANTLSKLKYSEDMKSELTVKSLKLHAEKIAAKAEEAEKARRAKALQELVDTWSEDSSENRKKKTKKGRKKKRKKKSQRRHRRKKSQKSYTSPETDEEPPTFSEPSYNQKHVSYERPEERILHALKNNPYKEGWRVHQRVKKWNGRKPTYDSGDMAHNPGKKPSLKVIAEHNLSKLIYLLASDIKDDYTVPYNFYDRESKSIYGRDKEGSALIAEMRYNGTTYSGTIFLGIGYDKKKRRDYKKERSGVLYHAQFVDYGHPEISLHDISKNIYTQLDKCSHASDRVETRAEDVGWKQKGKFTVEDGNVIKMKTRDATFRIHPIK